jgi:glycosyltransferase involved in cell wall biosynthesis
VQKRLKIVHLLRAPVGGLFRHVTDLARAQKAAGHQVGVICDSATSDGLTQDKLRRLAPDLDLGLHLVAMSRGLGARDVTATFTTGRLLARLGANIVHGHGAKGGAYARIAAGIVRRRTADGQPAIAAFYTPHGGSLHYAPTSLDGRIYMGLERNLAALTDGLIFESAYSAERFREAVGAKVAATRIIPNGVHPGEFDQADPADNATELLFIGELRQLKGVDVLLRALVRCTWRSEAGLPARATIVGDGPDAAEFKALSIGLGLGERVIFTGAMPARAAFVRGRVLVVPSRAESFPYIVLEAAAAALPMIATSVGGIPEITAGTSTELVPPGDDAALASAIEAALSDPAALRARSLELRDAVAARFTVAGMAAAVEDFYTTAGTR